MKWSEDVITPSVWNLQLRPKFGRQFVKLKGDKALYSVHHDPKTQQSAFQLMYQLDDR